MRSFFSFSLITVLLLLNACSSQNGVLEPQSEVSFESTPESATLQQLRQILRQLNYEGIGIVYESDSTLQLLTSVFSDPKTHHRELRLFYTGLAMAYDPKAQSLTIGGVLEAGKIISFIEKNIPVRKQ